MASKGPSPVLGFNTNVRHKGKVFHIQTEDSGVAHPHIITHLFADGGRILKTQKRGYEEHVGKPDLAQLVRKMMQAQHKEMFLLLQSGAFDEPEATETTAAPAEAEAAPSAQPSPAPQAADRPAADRPAADRPAADQPAADRPAADQPAADQAASDASGAPEKAEAADAPRRKVPSTEVDVRPVIDLSPGRYSSTRAPEIFRTPDKAPSSLFGDEHISEKSLDEVIMSYLAEDLGEDSSS